MDTLGELWRVAAGIAVVAAAAPWVWGYTVSGRHRKARQKLQLLVAEVLRDTGQGAFLFVLSRNARKVEVRIPADASAIRKFEQTLAARLNSESPGTHLLVVPLRERLDHLRRTVAVWGRLYGDVYVGKGGVDAREMSAMKLVIREESPSDAEAIHAVTAAAFLNAPHTAHTEQFIVEALRKAGALTVSLVAEQGGEVVGHLAVSPVSISDGSPGWFGLGPISVKPELQRTGIGSLLMRAALRRLREQGAAGCLLVGDPSYYSRFGFKPQSVLVLPNVPPEYFQVLPFGSSLPRGVVTFHEAFSAQG